MVEAGQAALEPKLSAHGLNRDACLQVAAACVCSAARNARWGNPQRFLVSPDGQRVGIQHENLRLSEVDVPTALQASTGEHLKSAQEAQAAHDQSVAERTQRVREPVLSQEPERLR